MPAHRRMIVGVMGSGIEPWTELSHPLGQWLARKGFHLLTGGGYGVMAAVSEGYCSVPKREGRCLGVVPTDPGDNGQFILKTGYPNRWIEIPLITPLPSYSRETPTRFTRNHINILTSDVIVALPGGDGTKNEIELAVRFCKKIVLLGPIEVHGFVPEGLEVTASLSRVFEFIEQAEASMDTGQ